MIVTLLFRRGEPLKISPDPAYVPLGQRVTWVIAYWPAHPSWERSLKWTLYFQDGNPFDFRKDTHLVWQPERFGNNRAEITSGPVERPGDYKYGIRTQHIDSGEIVSDDDPYLIVR